MQIRTPTSLFPERGCKLFVAPPCSVLVVLIDYFGGGVSRKSLPKFGTLDVFVSLFGCNLVDTYPIFHFEVKMFFRMSSVKIKCLLLFAMFDNILTLKCVLQ